MKEVTFEERFALKQIQAGGRFREPLLDEGEPLIEPVRGKYRKWLVI